MGQSKAKPAVDEKNLSDKPSTKQLGAFQFRTPANIQDFKDNQTKQQELVELWNSNLNGFIQQGMLGNPYNATNVPATTNYYNPTESNPPSAPANVQWSAFPGRLAYNFPSATPDQLNEMADTGSMPGQISNNPCGTGTPAPYFPYGPRGWQDEYCEWAVTRNSAGKITRIDFTCENPEYWNSVWRIDPNKVLLLYQSILNKPQITLQDLSVPGIVDPISGGPVYNPLNKWNSGPVSNATQGGAIHLTSTPNTLQTEIGLACSATVQRNNPSGTTGNTSWPSSQYNELLCDAQYGQKHRNSDPNIGGTVNGFVTGGFVVTLADPPGLYIQQPDFSSYDTPDNTDASKFWTIVRGSQTLTDQNGNQLPGNFILHAVFEVPADKGYTVSDILIAHKPINWASQVAATFKMQIVASAYKGTTPKGYDAVGDTTPQNTYPQPLQLFNKDYFNAFYKTSVPNPSNFPIPLLSNSTYIPPVVKPSSTNLQMVLTCATYTDGTTIAFDDPNITATITSTESVFYAVPGNSLPGTYTALFITVNVGANAEPGSHGVILLRPGQKAGVPTPALLTVTQS
jgi:hypothetical protein